MGRDIRARQLDSPNVWNLRGPKFYAHSLGHANALNLSNPNTFQAFKPTAVTRALRTFPYLDTVWRISRLLMHKRGYQHHPTSHYPERRRPSSQSMVHMEPPTSTGCWPTDAGPRVSTALRCNMPASIRKSES